MWLEGDKRYKHNYLLILLESDYVSTMCELQPTCHMWPIKIVASMEFSLIKCGWCLKVKDVPTY